VKGEKKTKEAKKKEKNKKMKRSTVSFLLFSLWAPSVVRRIETCIIPGACSSLE
jgi:hypothetical protein